MHSGSSYGSDHLQERLEVKGGFVASSPEALVLATSTTITAPTEEPSDESSPLTDAALLLPLFIAGLALVFGVNNLPELATKLRKWKAQRNHQPPPEGTSARASLPNRPSLVNRVTELSQILTAMADGTSAISIEGASGVGKSALALAAAHGFIANERVRHAEPDVLWLDAQDKCLTLEDFARSLSLFLDQPSISTVSSRAKEQAIRTALIGRNLLLVLDNLSLAQSVEQEVFLRLLETLPTGVRAIIAWSERPGLDLTRITVPELSPEDVARFIEQDLSRLSLQLSPDSISARQRATAIHAALGGNPQAIRWFLSELANSSLSLDELLERLQDRDVPLYEAIFGDVWSRLEPLSRHLLGILVIIPEPVRSRFLRAAVTEPPSGVAAALDGLIKSGLVDRIVIAGEPAVRLPMIGKHYVTAMQSSSESAASREALAAHYLRVLEADWEAAADLEPDINTIVQLMKELKARNDCDVFLKLFAAILDILFTLGLFDDRIILGHLAVDCAKHLHRPSEEALAWSVISSTHSLRSEFGLADSALRSGRTVAEKAGNLQAIVYQRRCRAYDSFRRGEIESALAELDGALETADEVGDPNGAIDIVAILSSAALYQRDLASAAHWVHEFMDRSIQANWRRAVAYPLRESAEISLMSRNFEEAAHSAAEARSIADEYRDHRQMIRIDLTRGRISLYEGQASKASRILAEALENSRRIGLDNEAIEIEAHLREARRRPAYLHGIKRDRRPIPSRLTGAPVGGD